MIYIETTVLMAYTLTKHLKPERYKETLVLVEAINRDAVRAVTSFYTLHEVFAAAYRGLPELPATGAQFGKQALLDILRTRIGLLPLITRLERSSHTRMFAAIEDPSDMPHAISAYLAGCDVLVSYNSHFRSLPAGLVWKTPSELLKTLSADHPPQPG